MHTTESPSFQPKSCMFTFILDEMNDVTRSPRNDERQLLESDDEGHEEKGIHVLIFKYFLYITFIIPICTQTYTVP